MKLPLFLSTLAAIVCLTPSAGQAQDQNPPYVANAIPNRTVRPGVTVNSIDLTNTFALSGAEGLVARFDTTLGAIDVLLRDDVAPQTVQNFLDYAGGGLYANTVIHRSIPGFVWQGGGYTFADGQFVPILTQPAVPNEFALSNVRGTIAMAKVGGDPNSATSQWFFNLADNGQTQQLDSANGGYTVFGQVITNGMDVVDTIAAVPTYSDVPLLNYGGGDLEQENLIHLNGVYLVPTVPATATGPALLSLRVMHNTNPGVVTARITQGHKLRLTYMGEAGMATISIKATNTAGSSVVTKVRIRKN